MDCAMANSGALGAALSVFASLLTLNYTIWGFSHANNQPPPGIFYTGQFYSGYTLMGWFGVICLSFCWTAAAYTVLKEHFIFALSGPIFILASSVAEYFALLNVPPTNLPGVLLPIFHAG